jgi:cytochrome c-type biogenesis protein CcmF
MIYELGHFSLILALAVALVQAVLPLAGAQRGTAPPGWPWPGRPRRAQCLFWWWPMPA